jgi:murein DD-endopeptidase MepM/ murein hydrolase activator NlpD
MRLVRSLATLSLLIAFNAAEALEVRFYPANRLYTYELDAARGVRSVLLQNVAIINDGDADVTIAQMAIELIAEGAAYETRTVRAAELDRIAVAGQRMQSSGMLKALTFQFGGARLLPEGAMLAASRVLKLNEALLVTHQVLAFSGKRDALRVRVQTTVDAEEAMIALSNEPSTTAFALPLEGTWHDGAGPSLHTHHRWVVPEEFAHDFTRIAADGLSYRDDGTRFSDYYAYAEPVFAAAAGRISAALNDEPEDASLLQRPGESLDAYLKRILERQNEQLVRGARGIVGNHVLIDHGGEYSLYAHLKPGSVKVKVGDTVATGQQIGAVGSSGSSTEPHLHFHVCDGPDVLNCAGIPARFENLEIYGALQLRELQSGDLVRTRPTSRK